MIVSRDGGRWMLHVGARGLSLSVLVSAALGCDSAAAPPNPASFGRPAQVTFACLKVVEDRADEEEVEARPLQECQRGDDDRVLHALVTQTESGEVALVDLESGKVLDSREDVPGYTFVDVGELPIAVIVPPQNPAFTYVANESGELGVFRTAALRPRKDRALRARAQDAVVQLPAGARATAMAIAPDERALFVAAENTGELFRVPICRDEGCGPVGWLLTPERVALPSSTAGSVARGPEQEPYTVLKSCAGEGDVEGEGIVPPQTPRWPADLLAADGGVQDAGMFEQDDASMPSASAIGMGEEPVNAEGVRFAPSALAIDLACDGAAECAQRLLVADAAQPIIHRFEIAADGLMPLSPLVTGTPTRALAVTPDVPVAVDGGDAQTHYVYAIDDRDGSVLVLQDGELLPVNSDPLSRVDRLNLGLVLPGTRALSLEVIDTSATSDPLTCELATNVEWSIPGRFRGVFLAVGTSDGTLQFYDIHDFDLLSEAQGSGSGTCRRCPLLVQRHRPRVGTDLGGVERDYVLGPAVNSAPEFTLGERTLPVRADGTTRDPRTPLLSCFPCPDGMQRAFTNPAGDESLRASDERDALCPSGEGRVCALADPFALSQDNWLLRYEGAVPEAEGLGTWTAGEDLLALQAGSPNLCKLGVLDRSQLPKGDLLELTTPPAPEVRSGWPSGARAGCQALTDALLAGERAVAFEILEAGVTQLRLDGENLIDRVQDSTLRGRIPTTLAEVQVCYGDRPVSFRVRAHESFLVLGAASGFVHHVISDASGRCVEDPNQQRDSGGRAVINSATAERSIYSNGRVAVSLVAQEPLPIDVGFALSITVTNPAGSLVVRPAQQQNALLQDLRYSATDNTLYAVDASTQQLVGVSLVDTSISRYQ